jgi:TRAP-type C4-dicarboxylate transport system permease small subunit
MAKPHKKKNKQKISLSTPPVSTNQRSIAPISPQEATAPRGKIRQVGTRLLDSAIESALSNVWLIIGGFLWSAAVTIFIAAYLFFRTPESAWVYSLLRYALVFMGGFLTFAFLLVVLALLGIRRRNQEIKTKLQIQRYVSNEKGHLDYRAELKPAVKEFQSAFRDTGAEIVRMGQQAKRIALWMTFFGFSPAITRWAAARRANAMIRGAQRMERVLLRLEQSASVYVEVVTGNARHAAPASQGNRQALLAAREALVVVDASLDEVISGLDAVRTSGGAVIGQQQNLNTAVNYITDLMERNIQQLLSIKSASADIFRVLDKKLSS